MRNDGFQRAASSVFMREAVSKIHASMLVVVVLPCVPQITNRSRPCRNSSWMSAAIEVMGMRSLRTTSTSALPRDMPLPTTTRSGRGSTFFASYGSMVRVGAHVVEEEDGRFVDAQRTRRAEALNNNREGSSKQAAVDLSAAQAAKPFLWAAAPLRLCFTGGVPGATVNSVKVGPVARA